MTFEQWLDAKTAELQNDLEYQRERLLYLLDERLAEMDPRDGNFAGDVEMRVERG